MNSEPIVRNARADDIEAIAELWKEFMDFHKARDSHFSRSAYGHKNFADFVSGHISSDDSYVLVAENWGDVIAYCLATVAKNPPVFEVKQYGAVFDLAVSEPYRRQGIGERMLLTAQDWFRERDIHRIEIRVALSNEVSTGFWRKMGFEPYLETVMKEI